MKCEIFLCAFLRYKTKLSNMQPAFLFIYLCCSPSLISFATTQSVHLLSSQELRYFLPLHQCCFVGCSGLFFRCDFLRTFWLLMCANNVNCNLASFPLNQLYLQFQQVLVSIIFRNGCNYKRGKVTQTSLYILDGLVSLITPPRVVLFWRQSLVWT